MTSTERYEARLREREARLADLDGRHALIGRARLGVAAVFAAVLWLGFGRSPIARSWLLLPAAAFLALVAYHIRVRHRRARTQRAAAFYRAGLARIRDEWRGRGASGAQFELRHHVYAADLDLFGKGSLFEWLCTARTCMGQATLARWLLAPADMETIRGRHASIADLRERLDLREEMAVLGESAAIGLEPGALEAWADAPNRLNRAWIRWIAPLLAVLALAGTIVWAVWGIQFPLLAVLLAEIAVSYALKDSIRQAIAAVESAYEDIKGLAALLRRIDAERFAAAPLRALADRLSSDSIGASAALSRLATIVNFVESRRNPILAPFMLLLMYPLLTALAAERWRATHGRHLAAWLAVLGEIEALLSLAGYAYEHPEHPFPEFVEGAAAFRAAALAHPLIDAAARVSNDVNIAASTRVLLVSGSNMSGKSTLLRTVGINTVLAMAGAPVCAGRLALTPLRVGASIRINDSLNEGSSRFYAEITRLRQLFEPAELPLLFLLDELLQGTNASDRLAGAQGVIRAFIERGAIGLITTHDLALADIPGLSPGALENVHFRDEYAGGRLRFDFKLRPGIVPRSNGIELMRSIGLDV